jgi:isoleucyl-tRNA synthetase
METIQVNISHRHVPASRQYVSHDHHKNCSDSSNAITVSSAFNFPEEEEKVLKFWREIDAFKTSLKLSEGRPIYSFYDGPPFATGLPHYGHLLAGTIKVRGVSLNGRCFFRSSGDDGAGFGPP